MDYTQLLKRAREGLPEIVSVRERFEVPKVKGHLQGNRTVISNFSMICSTLRRQPQHILKYLLKELATSGEIKNNLLVFNRKLSSLAINQKVRQYTNMYVLCTECGKPDTKILIEGNISYLKCQACGAKHHIKN
ncbi:translation initiation factor IF-2 subunit beta [Candidatus Woesearchaeota archaeon]|nr:translation initiation factor IF-2 subunit beta [Candidatus Woesearchaeota archaeon]